MELEICDEENRSDVKSFRSENGEFVLRVGKKSALSLLVFHFGVIYRGEFATCWVT